MLHQELLAALDINHQSFMDLAITAGLQRKVHIDQFVKLYNTDANVRHQAQKKKLLRKVKMAIKKKSKMQMYSYKMLQIINYLTKMLMKEQNKSIEKQVVSVSDSEDLAYDNRIIREQSFEQLQLQDLVEEQQELGVQVHSCNNYMVQDSDQVFYFHNQGFPQDMSLCQEQANNISQESIWHPNIDNRSQDKEAGNWYGSSTKKKYNQK